MLLSIFFQVEYLLELCFVSNAFEIKVNIDFETMKQIYF